MQRYHDARQSQRGVWFATLQTEHTELKDGAGLGTEVMNDPQSRLVMTAQTLLNKLDSPSA